MKKNNFTDKDIRNTIIVNDLISLSRRILKKYKNIDSDLDRKTF